MRHPNSKDRKYWLGKTFLIDLYQQDVANYSRAEQARAEQEYARTQEKASFQAQKEAAIARQREKETTKAAEKAEWQRQRSEAIAKQRAKEAEKSTGRNGLHEVSKSGEFLTVKNTNDDKYADGSYLASQGFKGKGNHITVIYDEDGYVIDTNPK